MVFTPSHPSSVLAVPRRFPLSSSPGCQLTFFTPFLEVCSGIVNVTWRLFWSNLLSPVYVNVRSAVLMVMRFPDFLTVYAGTGIRLLTMPSVALSSNFPSAAHSIRTSLLPRTVNLAFPKTTSALGSAFGSSSEALASLSSSEPRSLRAVRGSLVVMQSTPRSIIAFMSFSLFTVQTLTLIPRSCASFTHSGCL